MKSLQVAVLGAFLVAAISIESRADSLIIQNGSGSRPGFEGPIYGSLTGFKGGATVPMNGGDIGPATFQIGNGPIKSIIIYCVDIPQSIGLKATFSTMTHDETASAYNTWNQSAKIINDASGFNPGGVLTNGTSITWLMETYATAIDNHIASNSNVGTIHGVTFVGNAADAAMALQAALWHEVYGNAYQLGPVGPNFNNSAVVTDYNSILAAGIGTSAVSDLFWFNPKNAQQGLVGMYPNTPPRHPNNSPAPSTLVMLVAFVGAGYLTRSRWIKLIPKKAEVAA